MADSCKTSPTVLRRNGSKIEEVPSNLYKDIKKAVGDRDTAWKMWAYTKTSEFKEKYKDVEFDELGEVTFPSLLKALGLEETYESQKGKEEAARDYGFLNKTFKSAREIFDKVEEFNKKEEKYIAALVNTGNGFQVVVVDRNAPNTEIARQQSYNRALTGEILTLLRSLGFDAKFVDNPKFDGIFDPTKAELYDGLLQVIKVAKGERGEDALPEEFAHLLIEGLRNHPLVQRLFASINLSQLKEILGDQYSNYYEMYDGDFSKLKAEAAGKLLAQFITQRGTISQEIIKSKQPLLTRIWNWIKELLGNISNQRLEDAQLKAHDVIADIYNLVASGEAVPLIDKDAIMSSGEMYRLSQDIADTEVLMSKALEISARMVRRERRTSPSGKVDSKTKETHLEIAKARENADVYKCLMKFTMDARKRLHDLQKEIKTAQNNEENYNVNGIKGIRAVARLIIKVNELTDGYSEILNTLATLDDNETWSDDPVAAENIATEARKCIAPLMKLQQFKTNTEKNIIYNAARTVYKHDQVKGIGKQRDEIMKLETIIEGSDGDINFVDRWISAMSDANDALLPLIDGIVKNQQYERDLEMIEWKAQIDAADAKLRKAGYDSSFMYEMKDGIPTGKIISIYDWDGFNKARDEKRKELELTIKDENKLWIALNKWKDASFNGVSRLIRIYVDPEAQALYEAGREKDIPEDKKVTEVVPNPKIFSANAQRIEKLAPAQREYYNTVMNIKRKMMMKMPHANQNIFKVVWISKDLVEGVLDNKNGHPLKTVLDNFKKKYTRRPDDIGFGVTDDYKDDIRKILEREKDNLEAAKAIIKYLSDAIDPEIKMIVNEKKLKATIKRNRDNLDKAVKEVIVDVNTSSFYMVDTDFANHRIKKLPIYYTRPLKDYSMLSTDFSSTLTAYSAMAVNYEKMNEVVDVLEVARDYSINRRELREVEGDGSIMSKFVVYGKIFHAYVTRAANGTNAAGRINDYLDSVVYEQRKLDEGSFEVLGVNFDTAKTLDAIKDYTGLLGLGFNLFSTVSNIAVGKLQQWIEAAGGEYFTLKDYLKAVKEYSINIAECVAEMASPIKRNKLSLLIQMFDPMGDYFDSLRDQNHSKHVVSRILGNNALAYIGMNAGEHLLHCQTMIAILCNRQVINVKTKERKSLYDALQVKQGKDGVYRLELDADYAYEVDIIDDRKVVNGKVNKNKGKPLKDENGKIQKETIPLKGDNYAKYLINTKRIVRKVNDSLNGAFSANDKGAIHKYAIGRMILQFRQWMPAHYMRRFASGHYDNDLEQWREGYYRTVWRLMTQMGKDITRAQFEYSKYFNSLSSHEIANLKRATSEITLFWILWTVCKLGGRVKDRDRSWWNKMALYQINRMKLEIGASMPGPGIVGDLIKMLNSPAPTVSTLEKFKKLIDFTNGFDEIQTGRYQGWYQIQRDAYNMLPALPQITKAWHFDDSMFSLFETNR